MFNPMADNSGDSSGGGSDSYRDGSVGVYVWKGFGHTQLLRDCVALPSLNTCFLLLKIDIEPATKGRACGGGCWRLL